MRLVVDLQCCQSASHLGGIGRYSLNLARSMIQLSAAHEILVVLNNANSHALNVVASKLSDVLPRDRLLTLSMLPGASYSDNNYSARKTSEALREKFLSDLNPDAVHISSLIEGYSDQVVGTIRRYQTSAPPTAVTLYDLIPLENENMYLRDNLVRAHYLEKIEELQRADFLLSISEHSRQEALRKLPDFNGNIHTIFGGVEDALQNKVVKSSVLSNVRRRLALSGKYLLYVASFDARKNQRGLIKAFSLLPEKLKEELDLVIVGNGWPTMYEELHQFAESCRLPRSKVKFSGRVDDDTLAALYQGATCFVFPSLLEGLGLPVLEALAHGLPVVGSNTSSVPEFLLTEEARFDPLDAREMATVIARAVSDKSFRQQILADGAVALERYTWKNSGRAALEAFEMELKSLKPVITSIDHDAGVVSMATYIGQDEDQKDSVLGALLANEMEAGQLIERSSVACISTWNTRCGIATYAADLLAPSCKSWKIFAPYLGTQEELTEADSDNVIRCWRPGLWDDLSELEYRLWECRPEAVVIQYNFGFYSPFALNKLTSRLVSRGVAVFIVLHSTSDPDPAILDVKLQDLMPTLSVVSHILVHSESDLEALHALRLKNVLLIPHGIRNESFVDEMRGSRQDIRLATHGFFLPHKGLLEAIDTVALLRGRGIRVTLDMVNAEFPDGAGISKGLIAEAFRKISAAKLSDHVTVETAFLSAQEAISRLAKADLVLFPYQVTGESASGAVRKAIAAKRPLAVTPLDIFRDVREHSLVLDGCSPKLMAESLAKVLKEEAVREETLRALKLESERIAEVLSFGAVSRVLDKLVSQAVAQPRMRPVPIPPDRVRHVDGKSGFADAKSQGHSDVFLYGPYIALERGAYRLIVYGTAQRKSGPLVGTVTVTSDSGTQELYIEPLRNDRSGILADELVVFTRDLSRDIEFVFRATADSSVHITNYELLRL